MLFITQVSTTCFGSYGHLQVDRLTTKFKQLYFGMRLVHGGGGVGVGWEYEICVC